MPLARAGCPGTGLHPVGMILETLEVNTIIAAGIRATL